MIEMKLVRLPFVLLSLPTSSIRLVPRVVLPSSHCKPIRLLSLGSEVFYLISTSLSICPFILARVTIITASLATSE
jgi:hypothetical protein